MASGVKGKDNFFEDAKFLDFLFEKISDMVFIFPVEDSGAIGKMVKTNNAASEKLKLNQDELQKLVPYELFHEYETVFYTKNDILEFKKSNDKYKTLLRASDGHILNVESTIDFCKVSNKEFVVFAARDISRKLEAEKALKKSERKCSETILALAASRERLKMAMEAAEEALWDWNIKKGEMYFSPRYYSLLGYEPGDFPQSYNSLESLMHPDDFQEVSSAIMRYVK